jgi:DNA-directed RNA polymerase sigma subunit (sigma70/sigma32)
MNLPLLKEEIQQVLETLTHREARVLQLHPSVPLSASLGDH